MKTHFDAFIDAYNACHDAIDHADELSYSTFKDQLSSAQETVVKQLRFNLAAAKRVLHGDA